MSLHLEPGLYVRIQQHPSVQPRPLEHGFSETHMYRVLGMYNASESSEAFLILCNDRQELWFISNRHVRLVGLYPQQHDPWLPLRPGLHAPASNPGSNAHD